MPEVVIKSENIVLVWGVQNSPLLFARFFDLVMVVEKSFSTSISTKYLQTQEPSKKNGVKNGFLDIPILIQQAQVAKEDTSH